MILILAFFLLCGVGAYFIANSICKRAWKTIVPNDKSVYFLGIFLLSFFAIAFAFVVILLLAVPFQRTKYVPQNVQPVPDNNLSNH